MSYAMESKKEIESGENFPQKEIVQVLQSFYFKSQIKKGCGNQGSRVVINFDSDKISLQEVWETTPGVFINQENKKILDQKSHTDLQNKQASKKRRKIIQ